MQNAEKKTSFLRLFTSILRALNTEAFTWPFTIWSVLDFLCIPMLAPVALALG